MTTQTMERPELWDRLLKATWITLLWLGLIVTIASVTCGGISTSSLLSASDEDVKVIGVQLL